MAVSTVSWNNLIVNFESRLTLNALQQPSIYINCIDFEKNIFLAIGERIEFSIVVRVPKYCVISRIDVLDLGLDICTCGIQIIIAQEVIEFVIFKSFQRCKLFCKKSCILLISRTITE